MGLETALLVGSMALSGAGAMMNSRAQQRNVDAAARARTFAMDQEMAKQKKFQEEAAAAFGDVQDRFDPKEQKQAQDTETAQRTDQLVSNIDRGPQAGAEAPISGNAPQVVQSSIAKAMADSVARSKGDAQRLGALLGSNGAMTGNKFALQGGARNLATINDFSQFSSSLFPTRLESATAMSQKPISPIGDLFQTAGALGSYGAGRGWFNGLFGAPAGAAGGIGRMGFASPGQRA